MKKYTSKEAYYSRMKNLAAVDKTSVNESKNRNLGTLIDFKRTASGVAYGIIKEEHKYYIKKGGLKENQTVADFAYIGGLGNITNFEYRKLSEASKNRNMLLKTLNEGFEIKQQKTTKKGMLTEDKASKEIDSAENKLGDLDAATIAAKVPAEPAIDIPTPDAEMDAGLDAMGGDDVPADDGIPIDAPADGGEDMPSVDVPDGSAEGGEDVAIDAPIDGGEGGEEVAIEDPQSEDEREIEKFLGKITNKLRKTELTNPQIKSYVNTFLSAFKDKFPDVDIEDRKAMAEKITKVVPDAEIADLGQNVEDTEVDDEITVSEPEEEMAEQQCAECGRFAKYAESRGYNADSIKNCDEEEMTNMISGYANGHNDGQNDGDFKAIALFITPEIIEKLKGEYGHDDFANQVEPFSNEMNETSTEDRDAQINELFKGLGGAMGSIGKGIGGAVKGAGQAIAQKAGQVGQAVGQAATNVKQAYHTAEINPEVKKLEGIAANLGQQVAALNDRMTKAGKEPINVRSILNVIANKVAGKAGSADLSAYRTNEEGIPVDSTEVLPPSETAIEEDVTINVSEKQGKKLSPDNVPVKEMKEAEEKEGENIDINTLDVSGEDEKEGGEINAIDVGGEKKSEEEKEIEFAAGFDPMGGGVVKPDGAETTTMDVIVDGENKTVNVSMNESEAKLRKYIRNRLEERAGFKKVGLNENKKSVILQKLDKTIDKQFELYESKTKEKMNEMFNNKKVKSTKVKKATKPKIKVK